MSCIKTTYQAKIRCKHIYDLISGPPQPVHMWQAPLCTLTVIGSENSIEIDADNYSIYYTYAKYIIKYVIVPNKHITHYT